MNFYPEQEFTYVYYGVNPQRLFSKKIKGIVFFKLFSSKAPHPQRPPHPSISKEQYNSGAPKSYSVANLPSSLPTHQ